ncbi:hypothetical protein BGX27_009444, partial [Mortierella sp. AM989]
MLATSEPQEGHRGTSPPSPPDVHPTIPGSIFRGGIPPPSFADGAGYEPQQVGTSSSTGSSAGGGGGGTGNKATLIEVNSTIQTALVTLGICVGALFLLGVIATQYISHKNKRVEEKKKVLGEKGGMFDHNEGGIGGKKKLGGLLGNRIDLESVLIDEKGVDHDLLRPIQPPKSKSRGFSNGTPSGPSPGSTQSPKSSIIGGVGRAIGGGGHAGAGSFQMGASGPRGPDSANPRNSFMEPVQVYARRPSITPTPIPPTAMPMPAHMSLRAATLGYSQVEHPRHPGVPPELHLGSSLYNDEALGHHCSQDLASPMFAMSPSTIGTIGNLDKNPFASPPLSADSKSSLLLDPFRTQNNSQLSLSLIMTSEDNANESGGTDDDDSYPFPPTGGAPADIGRFTTAGDTGDKPVFQMRSIPTSNSSPSVPATFQVLPFIAQAPIRSLDNLSEPKLVLRQIQSVVPSYHRHTLMHTGTSSSPTPSVNNTFEPSGYSPSPTTRQIIERQAGFSPGVVHDRRSIAGSVVTPRNGGCHSSNGSINEGNAWYRKRASVIIPEGGTAHVNLWKDGESFSSSSPSGIVNRSSRSGSQSSSQSHGSHYTGTSVPSPKRLNRQRSGSQATDRQRSDSQGTVDQQHSIQRAQRRLDNAKEEEEEDKELGLLPLTITRNGAAVFEGKTSSNQSRASPPSCGASVPMIITDNHLVTEPEQENDDCKHRNVLSENTSSERGIDEMVQDV